MKIVCIGHNYREHIVEMGAKLPERPVFFIKPDTAIIRDNDDFYIPNFSQEVQYECEFVVKICKVAKAVEAQFANRYYAEVGLGIDFTARDLQFQCKQNGLPWEIAKGFDGSAVIGKFVNKETLGDLSDVEFELDVNGQTRQKGKLSDMIFSVDQIIAYVSSFVSFRVGDLLFTGTPVGVGEVEIGDRLIGRLNGAEMFNFCVK